MKLKICRMKKLKSKIAFYKAVFAEILETLCSICLYLETEGRYHNSQSIHMRSHFNMLKGFSEQLREELGNENKESSRAR